MLNCKDVDEALGERRRGNELDSQGKEESVSFISLIEELVVYVSMCACGTTRKHCVSLTSLAM